MTPLAPGAAVAAGEALALLVPEGPLRVAGSVPAAALGRVRPGQGARFWLRACPPPACAPLAAVVRAVAGEARSGQVAVELAPLSGAVSVAPFPLRHGMPVGGIEIDVGRRSPLELLPRRRASRFTC